MDPSVHPAPDEHVVIKKTSPISIGLILLILLALISIGSTYFLLQPRQPAPSSSTNTSPVPHWKIFADADKGIEFQYPDTWTVQTYPGPTTNIFLENHPFEFGVSTATVSTSITIGFEEISGDKKSLSSDQMLASLVSGESALFTKDSKKIIENFAVDGKPGTQLSGLLISPTPNGDIYSKRTYIPLGDTLMTITLHNQESEPIYDQMITTIKLLDKSSTASNGKTYTNPTFSYTLHIPLNYDVPPQDATTPIVVVRQHDQEEALTLTGFENTKRSSLDALIQNPPSELQDFFKNTNIKKVTVNGRDALTATSESQTYYVLTNGSKIVEITVNLFLTGELQSIVDSFAFQK